MFRHLITSLLLLLPIISFNATFADEGVDAELLFAKRVLPLLKEKCVACHGLDTSNIAGGLDLRTAEALFLGGDSELPIVVPREPEASPLFLSVLRNSNRWEAMPPKDNDALTSVQIDYLKQWIAGGAPWPEPVRIEELANVEDPWSREAGVIVKTTGGTSLDWTNRYYNDDDLWAYKPLATVKIPDNGQRHPIDAFVAEKLEQQELRMAPRADRRSIIRRLTMDLAGLPATLAEIADFTADPRDDDEAYAAVVERLLAASAYGEQMGRRWLDVVRYADSDGFSNDLPRANAWRYRDYVIRSFAADKPFNEFIQEQIAGDELPASNPDAIIATSFLRMGPWEHTGMAVAAETRQAWLDDVVGTIGHSFLAIDMSCFKCHDHKFDPLPTRDFYRMQAVFATAQLADVEVPFTQDELPLPFPETEKSFRSLTKNRVQEIDERMRGVARLRFERWAKEYDPYILGVYNGSPRVIQARTLLNPVPAERIADELMEVAILAGGAITAPGEIVRPGVLSAIGGFGESSYSEPSITDALDGRRLALAQWIVEPTHPLTARVIVNRVWGWHFASQPLVATPNNFGVTGSKPTHPELLDWLAHWFIENDWSIKKLSRLIVTSGAYRRSIEHVNPSIDVNDANHWLASFPVRRMTSEEIRDGMLAVSGELNPVFGGPPSRPEMNWDAATAKVSVQGGLELSYRPSLTPAQRNRRSIYAFVHRGRRDPLMQTFDQPSNEKSCERRSESIVVTQASTLLNGDFSNARAIALADAIGKNTEDDHGQIDELFRRVFARQPSHEEVSICREFLTAQRLHHQQTPAVSSSHKQRLSEVAGYDPDYTQTYIPDLTPDRCDANTLALADLALILLNSSEFLYLP